MMDMPITLIIEKIQEATGQSAQEVRTLIKKKLDELPGLISEEGAAHIVANKLGVKLHEPGKPLTIDKLQPGMRGVELVGKVRQTYEQRTFTTERRSGKVANLLLTDQTGTTRVVLWNEHADNLSQLKAGDILRIRGGYTKTNNDRVELHLGNDAKITINPPGITIDVDITPTQRPQAPTKRIAELSAEDQNVAVVATVVQVFDPRFFPVCPECNSRVKEEAGGFACPQHGAVKPAHNYVLNLYLDDGSDNVRCVLWREQVDALLGKKREDVIAYKDEPSKFEQQKTDLLGVILKVRGRVHQNETFGRLELVAYEVNKDIDPEQEIADLKAAASAPTSAASSVETKTEVAVQMDKEKVTSIALKEETSVKGRDKPSRSDDEEKVFTLDDIEDLEDLED